jgi:hypothetical protein
MKFSALSILLMLCFNLCAQDKPLEFDPQKWQPPYTLPTPQGWNMERFPFPIGFAPSILYQGVEDLRFTPGWADPKSEQYWTYSFLWFLEGSQNINEHILEQSLFSYYTGLVGRNIESRKIPKEKLFTVAVRVDKIKAYSGDSGTYSGTLNMLDYMAQKPIALNFLIHVRTCTGKKNTFVFFEISPKPSSHPIWSDLNQIWKGFDCSSK